MSATGLPEVADGGQHRRRAPVLTGPRIGLTALLLGIAAATVAVPPLIAPGDTTTRAPAAVPPPVLTPAASAPSETPKAETPKPGPAACAPDSAEVGTRPSCTVYDGSLGNGWSVTSAGLKVLPGELVPDTGERAMRVERSRPARPATELALVAAEPVRITEQTRLALRIWGGREHGTVLRISVGGGKAVTITAPADRWTSRTVRLVDLTTASGLTRIDLRVAADQLPNVGRFFLDDVTLSR